MAQDVASQKYYEQAVDSLAQSQQDFLVKSYNKTRAKSFMHKLGNSLGLVVVTLPLAGLFAAVGGIIMSKGTNEGVYTFGLILSDLGQTVLSNLGLLFMLAIVLGFTGNKGMALYATVIGYIAFVGFAIPFIRYDGGVNGSTDPKTFTLWFWHDQDVTTQLSNIFGLGQGSEILNQGQIGTHGEFARLSYSGIKSLNTGVLGGIALGFIYAWIYNKFKDMKLPSMLAFFEGEKFVALLVIVMAPLVSTLFIIVWPGVNYVLGEIGVGLSYLPYGIDSFFYGLINRWLLPFEAHPAFYGPLWWTSAGGQLAGQNQTNIILAMIDRVMTGQTVGIGKEASYFSDTITPWLNNHTVNGVNLKDLIPQLIGANGVGGTGFNGDAVYQGLVNAGFGSVFGSHAQDIQTNLENYGRINWTISGDQLISIELLNNNPGFDMRDAWAINLKVTRYISGSFAHMLFVLPVIGLAIWSTLDKERRGQKFGIYFGAMMSSFLLGITEPTEFMLAYGAPLIFFGVYAPFYGAVFLFGTLFQVRLGSTFSEGLIDYIVNGIIPTATRGATGVEQTHIWYPIIIGLIGAIIAFPLFRFLCIKLEFAAPGSAAAEEGIGVSQSRYSLIKPEYDGVVDYLGGNANIITTELVSATKLKVKVKRPERVINNDFTVKGLQQAIQRQDEFLIEAQNVDDGEIYMGLISDYKQAITKAEHYKELVKQDKIDNKKYIKSQIQSTKLLANHKKDEKTKIKAAKKDYKQQIKQIKENEPKKSLFKRK